MKGQLRVESLEGSLLAFKRADNSWHGQKPFQKPRCVTQFDCVTSEGNRGLAMVRHNVSAVFKRMVGSLRQCAATH